MRAAAGALASCVLLAGCGGSGNGSASAPARTPAPTPTGNGPEAQPGGAGDEQPARQRVRLSIRDDGIAPRLVKVSAFLPVALVVRNETVHEQIVTVLGTRPRRALSVGKGVTATLHLDGLRRGRYTIEGYAAGRATLVSSLDEP
jgi:hypothetical protein